MPPSDSEIRQFKPYLTFLARLHFDVRLRGKCDPSDIVQETFYEACRDWSKFRGSTRGEQIRWLRRILANNLLDRQRRYFNQRRDVALERSLNRAMEHSSVTLTAIVAANDGDTPLEQIVREETFLEVAEALTSLPSKQYEFIVQHHFEGKSASEIAQESGCSVPSVAGHIRRGLAEVRKRVRAEGEHGAS